MSKSEGSSVKVAMTSSANLILSLVTSVMMGASESNDSRARSGVVPGGAVGLICTETGAAFASGSATNSGGVESDAEEKGPSSKVGAAPGVTPACSDGHGCPVGSFWLPRTRTRRTPVP